MLANPTFPRAFAIPRPIGLGHLIFGLAGGVVWLHLLDASFVHPQANASLLEHVLQGMLALTVLPLSFLLFPRVPRGWRGAATTAIGLVTLISGVVMHIVGVIKNSNWTGSDYTGVPMAFAGLVLLILGIPLLTLSIPRARYRLLMLPPVVLGLMYVVMPLAAAIYISHAPRYVIEPQDLGAAYEDVSFETSDGLTIRGWYVPSRNGAAVAVMHGSGGARIRPLEHARMLVRHGYGVLLFDSRGHGESDGDGMAVGWGAYPDAAAAADFLAARPGVEEGRVGLLGLSMGAEIAIESAAQDDGFDAIVADGPSGRTFDDWRDSSPTWRSKILESGPSYVAGIAISALAGERPAARLTSLSPKVTEPVLYIASGVHAAEKNLVTKIAERSGGEHDLWVVDGVGHTQGLKKQPAQYESRVMAWFDDHLLAQ